MEHYVEVCTVDSVATFRYSARLPCRGGGYRPSLLADITGKILEQPGLRVPLTASSGSDASCAWAWLFQDPPVDLNAATAPSRESTVPGPAFYNSDDMLV